MVIASDMRTSVSLFTGLQNVNSGQGVGEAKVSFNAQEVSHFSLWLKLVRRAKLRPAGSNLTEEWQQRAHVKDSKLNEGQGTD
jgi:hypothetical protein